jgi:hypothetical protein
MWKEKVLAYLESYSRICLEKLRKNKVTSIRRATQLGFEQVTTSHLLHKNQTYH